MLNGFFQLFHNSPVRWSDYLKITGSTTYPKMFCVTRWLKDANVAETAIDVWDNVVKMFEFWGSLPKSKRPRRKSYGDAENTIKENLILCKLQSFATVANVFKSCYQTTSPVFPFLYDDLHSLVRGIMS